MCKKKHRKFVFYTGPAKTPPFRCINCESNIEYNSLTENDKYCHNIPKETLDET